MPYLNIDDNFDDVPKIARLSDAAFRNLMHGICAWSRTGETSDPLVQELLDERLVRRAPRHWLPEALLEPARRYRRKIAAEVRAAVYERDQHRCRHCGSADHLTLDHVVPWSLGGADDESNLQTLCRSCNSKKGARV